MSSESDFNASPHESSVGVKVRDGRVRRARARAGAFRDKKKAPNAIAIPVAAARKTSIAERLAEIVYVCFERFAAACALVVSAPIILLEAIAIRIDSPGPVLFFHERAGQSIPVRGDQAAQRSDVRPPEGGFVADKLYWIPQAFRFVKFRTMRHDALDKFPELYWWNYDMSEEDFQDIYHNLDDDPRVTRVGKFLRRTSLDELVNFWHVLTGECRLVGPRPEIMDILPYYTADEMRKFTVKPGVTCLWAIRGRGELSVREKNQLDLEYVDTRSVWLDIRILFLTLWCVVRGRGAF